jgi:hypothetical protein
MTTSDPRRTFLESLLRDDPAESEDQFQEYRSMLEKKLIQAERSYRTRRRFTIGLWVGIASLVLLGFLVAVIGGPPLRPAGLSLVMVAYGLGYLGLLRLVMFVFVDRYRVERVRDEARDAALLDLSRRVEALSTALLAKPKSAQ